MRIKQIYTVIAALLAVLILPSCAVTTAPTEASSKTTGKTTKASTAFTSSTSTGDGEKEEVSPDVKAEEFARSNSSQLRSDMAVGGGEYVAAFAATLNINDAKKDQFYALAKTNFDQIFVSSNTNAKEVVSNTRKVIDVAGI
ncbi:MAG: hypothetical protein DRQ61_09300 [Gammaproteobacteria bacterium]|nr:MAG: hypothetical protein DRQ56_07260 [Gammaproteobacteria bacterium]RLA20867.1 MAG: hypothetical protein DRQ61_09300 [Gammaproteobacteria bacterium]